MIRPVSLCFASALALAACSQDAGPDTPQPTSAAELTLPAPSRNPAAKAIEGASFEAATTDPRAAARLLIRAQILLDRAHFSPGVIDGRNGETLRLALLAYQQAHDLPPTGALDAATWGALEKTDGEAVLADYEITDADVKGPFVKSIPKAPDEMAKLKALAYANPLEALAEKFHMDEALLQALNPGADFSRPGQKLIVARLPKDRLQAQVTRVEVDKTRGQVRAFNAEGALLAVYPATVGSGDYPAPDGAWAVRAVAENPTWNYDPDRLSFGHGHRKQTIAPGPNNPVGAVWIALTKDTYGIHGSPEPKLIGKTASHGCVRLTNWDARELAGAVKPGTTVTFVGDEPPRPTA